MLLQVVSVLGASLILVAYASLGRGWLTPRSRIYALANLVGSLLLLWVAVADQRMGFILLEALWALVSIPTLFKSADSTAVHA